MLSLLTLLFVSCLVALSRAQTPSGFTPSVNTQLMVMFNGSAVATPGQLLTKAGTASQPQIGIQNVDATGTFLFVMMDLDVPSMNGSTARRTLLHNMQTGFKATSQRTNGTTMLLSSTDTGPATYIGPSPPVETPAHPHRYVQLLFNQPSGFSVPANTFAQTSARIGFDINSFMQQHSLAAPMAGNFFTVVGQNAAASGTASGGASATGSGGLLANTLAPGEGAAGRMGIPAGLAAVFGLVAVVV